MEEGIRYSFMDAPSAADMHRAKELRRAEKTVKAFFTAMMQAGVVIDIDEGDSDDNYDFLVTFTTGRGETLAILPLSTRGGLPRTRGA